MRAAWAVLVPLGAVAGCAGGGTACTGGTTVTVSPATATADHSASTPGNQQKFAATEVPTAQPGCAVPQFIAMLTPAWSSSDPLDVTVSSAQDSTNGLATCVDATTAPVTLTATGGAGTGSYSKTVMLSCK